MRASTVVLGWVALLGACDGGGPDPSADRVAALEARIEALESSEGSSPARTPASVEERASCDRLLELGEAQGMFRGPNAKETRNRVWLQCVVDATETTEEFVPEKAAVVHQCAREAEDVNHLRACYSVTKYRNRRTPDELRKIVACASKAKDHEELDACD